MKADVKSLCWQDIRDKVHKVNPEFATIVDKLNPDKSYVVYDVTYPFGAKIFNEGILNIPDRNGSLIPITNCSLLQKEDLTYRAIPMGLVLNKAIENHIELNDRVIPLTLFSEGTIFGAWETLDPLHSYFIKISWNVTSGGRSIFMLPKIAETLRYKKMQRDLGIRINAPKKLKDHWKVFKDIANSSLFPEQWYSEILLFGKKWFEKIQQKDKAWLSLRDFLFQTAWFQSMYWRFLVTQSLVWQKFSSIVKENNIKWGSYQLETVKHLITLGTGALPSFTAYDPLELTAPIKNLQKVFLDSYNIEYTPTILVPHHVLPSDKGICCYYSINEPTLIESTPKTREISNIMQVTREVKILLDSFMYEIKKGMMKMENTPIYKLADTVKYDFIHTSFDPDEQLILSSDLPKKDLNLLIMPDKYADLPFSYASNFLRGAVVITPH